MDEVRRKGFWAFELFSWMFGIFGGLALVLGSAGVFGVLSYAVSQRTQELGIRIALGASSRDVLALTVGHGVRLIAAGVLLGVVGAAAITRVIGTLLYDVTPTDPVSFVAVIAVLGGVGLLASYLPARRAMRINPVTALRSE
jgi:putative ABC transport system permease protein